MTATIAPVIAASAIMAATTHPIIDDIPVPAPSLVATRSLRSSIRPAVLYVLVFMAKVILSICLVKFRSFFSLALLTAVSAASIAFW